MHAVALLNWALALRTNWEAAPSIGVYIDGKLTLDGNLNALTNPMIEAGLVNCRALIEFLGLNCNKHGSLGQIIRRKSGDVGVEDFQNADGHLKKVDPKVALSRYGGDPSEAERALLSILHLTNKGIAHTTMDLNKDPEHGRLIEIASRGVPSLMISYFYTPLGLHPPDTKISTYTR